MNASAKRCRERVPDNGDDYACDNPLPCARHPADQTAAHETLDAIHARLSKRYALGETYRDRLHAVADLVDAWKDQFEQ